MKAGERLHVKGPVWLLIGQRRGRFPFCHGVLIKDRTATALVDPGCGLEQLKPLAASGEVDLVINSHTHPDHCAGNHLFQDSDILVPRQAWREAGRKDLLSKRLTTSPEAARVWMKFVEREMGFQEHRPSASFVPEQEIKVGDTIIRVMHTPGHTKDHCCLYLPQHDILLSADIDLTSFGPYYGHRESDLQLLRDSVARVKELNPAVMVSSHREPLFEGIPQALDAFLEPLKTREQALLALLATEHSLAELVEASPIYGGHPFYPELLADWEGQMITKHLEELVAQSRIQATERGFLAC